jgi:O-antigen ligase
MAGILLIILNFTTTQSIKIWQKALIIVLFMVFALSIFENLLFATGAGEKLLSTGDSTSDKVREIMIGEALGMFANNPIIGVGLGNVVVLSTFKLFSHNDFLEVAATLGIVGLTFYSFFLIKYYRSLRRLKEVNRMVYLTFLNNFYVYLFMGLFSVWFTDAFYFILLFMQVAECERLILVSGKKFQNSDRQNINNSLESNGISI